MANKRLRPPKPPTKDSRVGRGDIALSIGDDDGGIEEGDEPAIASWTGDLLIGMSAEEAVSLATDILLSRRNAPGENVEIWLPTSTVRIYKPE